MSEKRERVVLLGCAACLAAVVLTGCGSRSFVMPARDGTLWVTGSSARLTTGAQEKLRLMQDVDAYCQRRGKSAVVVASSMNDASAGTLGAPGKLARATVQFRCQ